MKSSTRSKGKSALVAPILAATLAAPAVAQTASAPAWQAIPMVEAATLKAGLKGGEGGQWPRCLAISQSDPRFLMMGTDVGGIYRSLDGGANWQVCMVGWNSRGANAFAIDPKNARRVIGVGGNSNDFGNFNGLYLSTDQGASWKHTVPMSIGNDDRESVAYDPSSFNKTLGHCTVAYYDSKDKGLYKTWDGGATWKIVNADMKNCIVRVHPTKGFVYLASNDNPGFGFYKSVDGGVTFKNKAASYTLGLDVSPAAPDNVYLSRWDKVQISTDAGETFRYIGADWKNDGLPENAPIQNLTVSPLNPNLMACWHDGGNYQWVRYHSVDGGKSWKPSVFNGDARRVGNSTIPRNGFLPFNVRNGIWAYHPKQANIVFGIGGDWITKSVDAGANFAWSSSGENAIMVGGMFNFSSTSPNTICLAFQDYNAAFTLDGGKSWNYRDVSGKGWGGFDYGGYAVDNRVMWVGDAESWGGPRQLKVSLDGGATWNLVKGADGKPLIWSGPDVSYSDPKNPNNCFASNYRSTDKGQSWAPMVGCDGVFTSSPKGARELFGRKGNDIVQSVDGGANWTKVATVEGGIGDIAYDANRNRFYIASQDRLKQVQNGVVSDVKTPGDQYGAVRVSTAAVDSINPSVVYAGNHKDLYACNNAVVRSTDGGLTWTNLTVTTPLRDGKMAGGPHEVSAIRVHPITREAWVSGQCFGLWKIAAPVK